MSGYLAGYLSRLRDLTAADGDARIPLAAYEALRQERVVIAGGAGAGKTTFLRHIAFLFACGIEDTRTTSLPFPILLSAKDLAGLDSPAQLIDWLAATSGLPLDFLRDKLMEGFCVLLLDGLEEAPEAARLIEKAALSFRYSRWIVATRPLPEVGEALIAGFETVVFEAGPT